MLARARHFLHVGRGMDRGMPAHVESRLAALVEERDLVGVADAEEAPSSVTVSSMRSARACASVIGMGRMWWVISFPCGLAMAVDPPAPRHHQVADEAGPRDDLRRGRRRTERRAEVAHHEDRDERPESDRFRCGREARSSSDRDRCRARKRRTRRRSAAERVPQPEAVRSASPGIQRQVGTVDDPVEDPVAHHDGAQHGDRSPGSGA